MFLMQDAYEIDDSALNFVGSISQRLQVTSSKSGIHKEKDNKEVDPLDGMAVPLVGKREITLVDARSADSPEKPAKRKRVASSTPRTPAARAGYQTAEPDPASEETESLSCPVLRLSSLPVDVTAADVTSTLFSGLSVSAVYVCRAESEPSSGQSPVTAVDVYVEFAQTTGAELGLQRDGERLVYKSSNTANSSGGNNSSSSSSQLVRQTIVPEVDPVEEDVALWVRQAALRVSALTDLPGGKGLGARSTFREHIESAQALLGGLGGVAIDSGEDLGQFVLCNVTEQLAEWQPVMTQLMLPPGSVDAYSADNRARVRINKDTEYLFANPAVDDLLLSEQFLSASPDMVTVDGPEVGEESKGDLTRLYSYEEDQQQRRYRPFMVKAERELKRSAELLSLLQFLCNGETDSSAVTSSDGTARRRYVSDVVKRRIDLYRVLYKEAWSLCTTFCMFDK